MKKHILFTVLILSFTALCIFLAYDLATVDEHVKSQYTTGELRTWQLAVCGLGIAYPLGLLIIYILWYQPSWGIQKPKIEKLGAAQKRKRKKHEA